ncbi:ketopantoate reductase PanE/ApbA C terminal-domain-containing protein [Gaertneriomyces semiglobifer]|nr:ketopantoate reductase PanE/ApbA C terminal-domain-containing protein [Gaertneriomyces semiglobifer]
MVESSIPTVVIVGCGLVGSYLGAHLAANPHLCTVHLVGRESQFREWRDAKSLSAQSGAGTTVSTPVDQLNLHLSLAAFAKDARRRPDYIVVTTKRLAAPKVYEEIRSVYFSSTTAEGNERNGEEQHAEPVPSPIRIVPLMNGARPERDAESILPPGALIHPGMWPFNVISPHPSQYHQTSGGQVFLESETAPLASIFTQSGIPTAQTDDIEAVLYGKLLVNLHNAVSALTGLTIHQEFLDLNCRKIWGGCIREALQVYRAHGINTVSFLPFRLPYSTLPYLLSLPTLIFSRLATSMLAIDPRATSSMYEDLKNQRTTEIAFLQGHIVDLGREVGVQAPMCERVYELVKRAEAEKKGPGFMSADQILDALECL